MHVQRKEALDLDDMVAIATVGAHECLRSGITTIGDCSFSGAAATAAAATGLRAIVYLEVFGRDASALDRFHELRARVEPLLADRVARRRLAARAVHLHDRGVPGLRGARASPGDALRRERRRARLARRREPVTGARWPSCSCRRPGETGIRLLAAEGLLGPGLMAAHCVHADAEEIALLAAHGVGVAHCPRSNGYLGCGVAPLEELLAAGVAVSIATDSPASTPSLDLFEELRTAIVGARARAGRPEALSAAGALELATLGGARVLGMDDRIGSLVPGKQADLAVISLAGSPFDPVEDPVTAAVLGGSPERVTATLVAGEPRYLKGTSRWPDSTRAARSARSKMLP